MIIVSFLQEQRLNYEVCLGMCCVCGRLEPSDAGRLTRPRSESSAKTEMGPLLVSNAFASSTGPAKAHEPVMP